jgi:uncharacterized protein
MRQEENEPGAGIIALNINFEVEVFTFEMDLIESASCYLLKEEIDKLDITLNIIINNAGVGGTHAFEDQNVQFYERLIRLNILSTTMITRLFVDNLEQCKQSYILNVGSLASFFPMPYKQVYAGTKAYIYHFSRSLKIELQKKNISVTVLCPGGINSNPTMTIQNRNAKWLTRMSIMNPEEIAVCAIDGLFNKKNVIIPGMTNRAMIFVHGMLPGYMRRYLVTRGMKGIISCRKESAWMDIN